MTVWQRRLTWVAGLVLASVIAAGAVAWFRHTHERHEQKVRTPHIGEARTNPLYALRQILRADGIQAHTYAHLDLDAVLADPADTLLIHRSLPGLSSEEQDALLDWVDEGGHLLVRTPELRAANDEMPELLQELGLDKELSTPKCEDLHVQGEEVHVEFCRGRRFELEDPELARLTWPEQGPHVFARLEHGRGSVDVLADFDFLHNKALDEVTHQALARQLLAPNYGQGAIHLVYASSSRSRWLALLERVWPMGVPLLLLVLAWLWRQGQRFGPWLPAPQVARRSLIEHVRASGELLYRYGHLPALHAAVREAFLARLQRRDPASASLSGEARIQAIAERVGLSPLSVREALATPQPNDRHAFLASVRTLILMRNRL